MPLESLSLPEWLVDCTLQGSIAIVLVFALGPLVRRFLGAQAAYLLWAIVILRLLVPWLPATPLHWGVPSVRPEVAASALSMPGLKITATAGSGTEAAPRAGATAPLEKATRLPPSETKTPVKPWPWSAIAFAVWLVGLMTIVGCAVLRGIRASWLVRRAQDISDGPWPTGWPHALRESRVRIKETGELRSPALTGVMHPTILLPLDWRQRLSTSQLQCVLAHELGHFHRGDLLWRWIFLIARSVHWFNPLVWLAERLARTDQEMACDEWVLLRDTTSDPQTYGEALIASARKLRDHNFAFPIQAGMAESRTGLKRRIRHLAGMRAHGWRAMAASLLLCAVLIVLTGPARSEAPPAPGEIAGAMITDPPSPTPHYDVKVKMGPQPTPRPSRSESQKWPGQVQIESKFVEIPAEMATQFMAAVNSGAGDGTITIRAIYSRKEFQDLIRSLDQKKGVDLMSAPTVTTKSGNKCVINIIREFRYPSEFFQSADGKDPVTPSSFETRNLGVTLEATPTLTPSGDIELALAPEVVDFAGFLDYGGSRAAKKNLDEDPLTDTYQPSAAGVINQPIFSVRRIHTTITLHDGETAVLGGVTRDDTVTFVDNLAGKLLRDTHTTRALFIFVTAKSIDREGRPVPNTAATPK